MEALQQKLVEVISQLQGTAPAATELALRAIWLDSFITLLTCVAGLGLIAALLWAAKRLYNWHLTLKDNDRYADFTLPGVAAIATVLFAGFLAVAATVCLLSTHLWLGLYDPKAALAAKALSKLL